MTLCRYKREVRIAAAFSGCDPRAGGPCWHPPIDAFEQHRQLRVCQCYGAALGLWPNEAAAFKPFCVQHQALAIPQQRLQNRRVFHEKRTACAFRSIVITDSV